MRRRPRLPDRNSRRRTPRAMLGTAQMHSTPGGDDAAERLFRKDSRVVRVRPALDGDDWNDMRRRDLQGNMLEIDDRLIG